MSVLRPGQWQIQSVLVNDQTVLNNEGFLRLDITPTELAIEPIGFRFRIEQSTAKSAVLESRGRVFFADFVIKDDEIDLKLTRPELTETIRIGAEFMEASVPSVAETV